MRPWSRGPSYPPPTCGEVSTGRSPFVWENSGPEEDVNGGDAVKVKEAMGHADLRTTMDYTHLVRDNLRSLVEPVGRSREGSAEKDAKTREVVGVAG